MQNRFFVKTQKQQHVIQFKILICAIFLNIVLGSALYLLEASFLIFVIISITLSIIAPFIDVPSGIKNGNLIYYSPLLIGEAVKNKILKLHGGTLFDYYYVLNRRTNYSERKRQVFKGYIDGLLNVIEKYETTPQNAIRIKATSYIINTRTAQKIGLHKVKTDFLGAMIIYFNYFNLLCSLSMLNAKLTFPNMDNVCSFEGDLNDLMCKKDYLLALKSRI
jgi:hypothetical protein